MVESLVNLASEAVCFRSRESVIYLRIPWNDAGLPKYSMPRGR
jgi:hypothetical protein